MSPVAKSDTTPETFVKETSSGRTRLTVQIDVLTIPQGRLEAHDEWRELARLMRQAAAADEAAVVAMNSPQGHWH